MDEVLKKQRWVWDLDKHKNHTDQDAKDWVEANFAEQHYGPDILWYEAWPLRSILEQAYMAGKEYNDLLKIENARMTLHIADNEKVNDNCQNKITKLEKANRVLREFMQSLISEKLQFELCDNCIGNAREAFDKLSEADKILGE